MSKVMRRIIRIDEDKCDGCGLCADACHEGAIRIVDGKAKLVSDRYCDGLGDCIGECPRGAISFETREADAYDEDAVKARMAERQAVKCDDLPCGCPGSAVCDLRDAAPAPRSCACSGAAKYGLTNWPIQIRLVPENAPWLKGVELVVAADCTPFAFSDFHSEFLSGDRVCLVGCPKLDDTAAYAEKLARIISANEIDSVIEVRMEVPCCGGLTRLLERACEESGRNVSLKIYTIGVRGDIIDKETIRFSRR
ncbi:MAG: 4Fe-4S binding protein [Synergistota bacterium]|nr:4Fe-4S binding protein [Synergistota bacterium]